MSATATSPAATGSAADLELAQLAKALAHPARVRIMRLLLDCESCFCAEIVARMPLAQATVSQHLKVLRDAGLVEGEIDGPRTCYWASRTRLADALELLAAMREDAVELDRRVCEDC